MRLMGILKLKIKGKLRPLNFSQKYLIIFSNNISPLMVLMKEYFEKRNF